MSDTALAYYTVLSSIGVIVAVLFGLGRALDKAGWQMRERAATVSTVALFLAAWFGVTVTLAWLDAYYGGPGQFPMLPVAMLLPILAGALLIRRSHTAWRVIEAVPQQWLVGVQLYRIIGIVFVVLWAGGSLPGAFALPAGLGDLATGVLAPFAALAYVRNTGHGTGSIRQWNLLGIADLVVAFITGLATAPRLAPLFGIDAPNVLIDRFPLVLIPAFVVPLSAVLHIASLAKVHNAAKRAVRPGTATASA